MSDILFEILEVVGSAILSTAIAYVALRERILTLEIKQKYMEASVSKGHATMDEIKKNLEQVSKNVLELKIMQQQNNK